MFSVSTSSTFAVLVSRFIEATLSRFQNFVKKIVDKKVIGGKTPLMSEKCDKMKQVRLYHETHKKLIAVKNKMAFRVTIGDLANLAITKGLPLVNKGGSK